ncbi:fimbrial protein pilin [Caballeronia peredens]|nr:fimbrial protein pilin [Caballeronia peredens]
MKRMVLERTQEKGFMLMGLMAGVAVACTIACMSVGVFQSSIIKGQVEEAEGFARGLTVAAAVKYKYSNVMPNNTADLTGSPIQGSRYASYTISNGHIIVTFGAKASGSQNAVNGKIQDATMDFAPDVIDDGSPTGALVYTCSVDNSYLWKALALTQCALKAPVKS